MAFAGADEQLVLRLSRAEKLKRVRFVAVYFDGSLLKESNCSSDDRVSRKVSRIVETETE